MKITFLKVSNNVKKIQRLLDLIHHHFYKGHRIQIVVPNITAGNYINDLLWSTPPESFIPHVMTDAPVADQIVITQRCETLNRSSVVVNLSQAVWEQSVDHLYELLDMTSKEKEQQALNKIKVYGQDLVSVL
jgi:DNA polymerase IIIc chi subunit